MSITYRWFSACQARRGLSSQSLKTYASLKMGMIGEEFLNNLIQSSEGNYLYLKDRWFLNDNQLFQTDGILISNGTIYIIEVKNYQNDHHFKNGEWWINGQVADYNPFSQMKRSIKHLKKLLKYPKIEGVLVYISETSQVTVDKSAPFKVVRLPEIKPWLQSLQSNSSGDANLLQQIDNLSIDELQTGHLYKLQPDYPIKKGCYCLKCGSFDLTYRYKTVTCRCGYTESKTQLLSRMIDEYGLLFYQRDIHIEEIIKFTKNVFSKTTYQKTLKQYKQISKTTYANPYNRYLPAEPVYIED